MSSVARVSQISARSEMGIEDAVKVGLERANQTLRGITGVWIKDIKVEANDGVVTAWQVMMEVTFVLDEAR